MKKGLLVMLCALCVFVVSGCSGAFDPTAYVKGSLDAMYLGEFNDDYVAMLDDGTTVESLQEDYEKGLEAEADFFAEYFEVTALSEGSKAKLVDMYKEIYSHAKYEVGEASGSDTNYSVPVTIYPMDIIAKVIEEDFETYANDFNAKLEAGDFDALSDEEFEDEWVNGIVALINARMDSIDYQDSQVVTVTVVEDADGLFTMDSTSITNVDTYIIAY